MWAGIRGVVRTVMVLVLALAVASALLVFGLCALEAYMDSVHLDAPATDPRLATLAKRAVVAIPHDTGITDKERGLVQRMEACGYTVTLKQCLPDPEFVRFQQSLDP